ncbi:MAG: NifU family protein [Thermoanaerobaculaceae bacterium]
MTEGHLLHRVQQVLADLRPALAMDGGDVELVDVADGVVKVKLLGACGGCPMAAMTLVGFVEEQLRNQIPEVRRVESI